LKCDLAAFRPIEPHGVAMVLALWCFMAEKHKLPYALCVKMFFCWGVVRFISAIGGGCCLAPELELEVELIKAHMTQNH
jgi:hypothetical protein